MIKRKYNNFVKAGSVISSNNITPSINGDVVRQMYLEEVKGAQKSTQNQAYRPKDITKVKRIKSNETLSIKVSDKDLFLTVQNNDDDALRMILDCHPEKLNVLDEFGWSLLMIACQANAIDTTRELFKRGIDTSVRDKAGNSAQSLVIKNKSYALADVLLSYKSESTHSRTEASIKTEAEEYFCDVCNKNFPDRERHLSSTLHNISASKGKKIPASYVIPQSNVGYQLMLKVGWDRESGLGRDGMGKRYPIKAVQKKDRKGLGHGKRKQEEELIQDSEKHKNRRMLARHYDSNKRFEINFRRQFY